MAPLNCLQKCRFLLLFTSSSLLTCVVTNREVRPSSDFSLSTSSSSSASYTFRRREKHKLCDKASAVATLMSQFLNIFLTLLIYLTLNFISKQRTFSEVPLKSVIWKFGCSYCKPPVRLFTSTDRPGGRFFHFTSEKMTFQLGYDFSDRPIESVHFDVTSTISDSLPSWSTHAKSTGICSSERYGYAMSLCCNT